ncbi:CarboxypepD_reg-like domain-containing protein [Dyadobacter sp. SG02]|uniref:TonB-dependent receptor n=1 Tax=Dyadobacter sp. SG02 TaxID=1855291 RepID=UPI0008BA6F8D|nr:TonB-dependent receptor [Dyadobacter sp. SG02]SEJ15505.1 CarboxypepD_reg-like domain-containing protein [Dyadobacter sp. SG02]
MIRILLLFLFSTSLLYAQEFTSVVRGSVKDADTGLPLARATVQLDDKGTATDDAGLFRFEGAGVGRHVLKVSFVGYQTLVVSEILLESGKENVQEIRLSATGRQLQEATVSGSRPPAFNSVQAITAEQTLRYAATYLDPARVATSFAGVAAANDQANGLVVRGNSPNSMQWRLEGVEIVNPNHLSNAGTFSDRPTSTGGGVNILSTQLMGTSYFMSGPFPAQYGNATGAILDMNLRKGNDERTEFTGQASLIGLDIAAEGRLSKKSKASYLVNYRYSFTGLLGAMGVSFGGEDIRFQDLSFNLNFPTAKGGKFTIFGMGGISENTFKPDKDTTTWEFEKDGRYVLYKNKMGAAGATLDQPVGRRASLRTVLVASGLNTSRKAFQVDPVTMQNRELLGNDGIVNGKISFNTTLTYKVNPGITFKGGVYMTSQRYETPPVSPNPEVKSWYMQPFVNWSHVMGAFVADVGLHGMISRVSSPGTKISALAEPRVSLKWLAAADKQLSVSYGLHSQLQSPNVYSSAYGMTDMGRNFDLKPTRSHQITLAYQQFFKKGSSLKIEAYWQHQFDVPVGADMRDNYSTVNLIEERPNVRLYNEGTARNYGMEATFQKYLTDRFYMLVSGSLYQATYTDYLGLRHDSRFDGGHTFSLTTGKEFKASRGGLWGVNAKILWLGGFRDKPIDAEYSAVLKQTIYEYQSAYTVKMKDYFRPDLRIYWKKDRAKYNRTLAIDLQNVSGTKNEAYRYFDTRQKRVVVQHQLGLIPVVSYRVEF